MDTASQSIRASPSTPARCWEPGATPMPRRAASCASTSRARASTSSSQAFGAADPDPFDWGRVPARPYATEAGTTEALAFEATYDHGFLEVRLQANVKAGVLVVASLNRFVDDSGRSSYFFREFYYRPPRHEDRQP